MSQNISLTSLIKQIVSLQLHASIEEISISQAKGRVLAQDLVAPFDSPLFDNSAMDGFAFNSVVLDEKTTITLPVIETVLAGHPSSNLLRANEAFRVMTGAAIPPGADTVIPFELTTINNDGTVSFRADSVKAHDNVRKQGEEFSKGNVILSKGTRINPFHIGIAASLGYTTIKTYKISVGVFSTGDELATPGENLKPGQIYNSNTQLIAAICESFGCSVTQLGKIPDDLDTLKRSIIKASENFDILITSGGVGEGDKDLIGQINKSVSHFHIQMRPGKPFAYCIFEGIKRSILLGLPGNPIAAAISTLLFVRALIGKMTAADFSFEEITVYPTKALKSKSNRADVFYGSTHLNSDGILIFTPSTSRSSAQLSQLKDVNTLIITSEEETIIEALKPRKAYKIQFL